MDPTPKGRAAVDAAVAALQERLADGDPADAALRVECEAVLTSLRAAYRADPSAFSPEAIAALQEFRALLSEG